MCFFCGCLTWCLDACQRALTFCLLTSLISILCLGFGVSIIAGIAYGYNYSLSEFMSYAKSDVTIYMRRGQINSRKYEGGEFRRMNDEPGEIVNASADYQEPVPGTGGREPLAETLVKSMDNTRYAEKLLKFAKNRISKVHKTTVQQLEGPVSYYRLTTLPVVKISIVPNSATQTTVMQNGTSEIIMRQFPPVKDKYIAVTTKDPDDYIYMIDDVNEMEKNKSEIKINQRVGTSKFRNKNKEMPEYIPTRRPLLITHSKESTIEAGDDGEEHRR